MGEDDQSALDPESSPAEAFALIGNETRAEILRVLGEHAYETLSFSEVREKAAADVRSSQFNYHLQQLVDTFVTHDEDGYQLRPEGLTLYRSIVAGTFTRRESTDSFDAGFDCHFCGTGVEASYGDARVTIQCPDCDHRYHLGQAPPSIAEGDDEAAMLERVDRFARGEMVQYAGGVCSRCASAVSTELMTVADSPFDTLQGLDLIVRNACDNCGTNHYMSVGLVLLHEPALIAFCDDHGLDVTGTPFWELAFTVTDEHTTVHSRAPWEVEFTLPIDDERLRVVLDGDMNVVERQREPIE